MLLHLPTALDYIQNQSLITAILQFDEKPIENQQKSSFLSDTTASMMHFTLSQISILLEKPHAICQILSNTLIWP